MLCGFRSAIAAAVVLAAVTFSYAEPTSAPQFSKTELQRLIKEAHTPQQYRTLADYFKSQQQKYEQQAQSEKQEWDRRSQNVTGPAAKYPRPVDSSRNRYEYFAYQAGQMAQQAAHFESLSASAR